MKNLKENNQYNDIDEKIKLQRRNRCTQKTNPKSITVLLFPSD